MNWIFKNLLILSTFILVIACDDQITSSCDTDISPDISSMTTLQSIQNNVFNPRCVSCHGGAVTNGGLDLSQGNAYQNLVNANSIASSLKRIVPGESQNSYLMRRLEGAGGETVMPPSGKLDQAVIDSIAAWIDRGALND